MLLIGLGAPTVPMRFPALLNTTISERSVPQARQITTPCRDAENRPKWTIGFDDTCSAMSSGSLRRVRALRSSFCEYKLSFWTKTIRPPAAGVYRGEESFLNRSTGLDILSSRNFAK